MTLLQRRALAVGIVLLLVAYFIHWLLMPPGRYMLAYSQTGGIGLLVVPAIAWIAMLWDGDVPVR